MANLDPPVPTTESTSTSPEPQLPAPNVDDRVAQGGDRGGSDIPTEQFLVRFWGVRGGVPTPGAETLRYGGNTTCVEVEVGQHRLIFDGGTGLRGLGKSLLEQMPIEAHLFFTHSHWDRIQGFPFFSPGFIQGNRLHIYGSPAVNGASIKQQLTGQMLRPNFPVPLQVMRAEMTFHDIAPGDIVTLGDVQIASISVNQYHRSLGYRVDWNGRSIVYATDARLYKDHLDYALLHLVQDADILIYDAAYVEHEYYETRPTTMDCKTEIWWLGLELAQKTNVKQIVMFHHDPSHDDEFLDQAERKLQDQFPASLLAREGMELQVKLG